MIKSLLKVTFVTSINDIAKEQWQTLNTSTNPFLQYDYIHALENSGSATKNRGWQPYHALYYDQETLVAILPLYIKYHSWGEYVFDHAWADAYEHYKIPYYPKLVNAVPFTPVPCNKLISVSLTLQEALPLLIKRLNNTSPALSSNLKTFNQLSGLHALFTNNSNTPSTTDKDQSSLLTSDIYHRHTVQFHWFNNGYESFDEYLASFTARKRKNTKKERASIAQQGITVEQIQGKQLTKTELDYFYLAYQSTYHKKGHEPHLSYEFFERVFHSLADNIMLVVAKHEDTDVANEAQKSELVACALFFHDKSTLYGRYWGCTARFNNLHFELCYYQGIEFCIKNNLQTFNPGTQGEHKIQRGFQPILTHSYHWIKHLEFKAAIADYCQQERTQLKQYQQQCQQALPFKESL